MKELTEMTRAEIVALANTPAEWIGEHNEGDVWAARLALRIEGVRFRGEE